MVPFYLVDLSTNMDTMPLFSGLVQRDLVDPVHTTRIINSNISRRYKIYWGVSPIDCVNVNHLIPLIHIAKFIKAGCYVKILIADLHGYLEKNIPHEYLGMKSTEYIFNVKKILKKLDVDTTKIEFVVGANFQLRPEYSLDIMRLMSNTTIEDAVFAGSDILKCTLKGSDPMTSLMYPIMQALDEHYMNVDAHFGDINQIKIMNFANEKLPLIGYSKKDHLICDRFNGSDIIKFDKSDIETKINNMLNLDDIQSLYRKIIVPLLLYKNPDQNVHEVDITIIKNKSIEALKLLI